MIPMRPTIIIIAAGFLACIVFLGTLSGNSSRAEYSPDSFGRVMGAEEMNPNLTLRDIGLIIDSLPRSGEKPLVEPEKSTDESFSPDKCLGAAIDAATGKVLYASEGGRRVPIASISKLITALVLLDNDPKWDEYYTITEADLVGGGKMYLAVGDRARIRDLFFLSLVGSSNSATQALVNSTLLGNGEFVALMNKKAQELGLVDTEFFDPIGLSHNNVSSVLEVAEITRAALAKPEIADAVGREKYEFYTAASGKREVVNTNLLLSSFPSGSLEMIGGKTGFTDLAGYCFTGKFRDSSGHEIISVILGGDTHYSRFSETERLVSWVYDNYQWQ